MAVYEGRGKSFSGQYPYTNVEFLWAQTGRLGCALTAALGANGRQNTIVRSDIEENRLVFALNTNVEAVDRQLASHLFVGNESPAPVSRHERQDGIAVVSRLVGEIEPGIDLPQHSAREDAEHDMRCLRLAVRAQAPTPA